MLKSVLAFHDARIGKTHNIIEIVTKCREHTTEININERTANALSDFAVAPRYTNDNRDFTEDTAQFALTHAEAIIQMVTQYLNKHQ